MTLQTLDHPGDYISGGFVPASGDAELITLSPADLSDTVGRHRFVASHIDDAVSAAREAQATWWRLGKDARVELLRKYQERLRHHHAAIAECIAREVGKPLWDAEGEARAMANKVDVIVGEAATFTAERAYDDLPGALRYRPHGVLAVIGPFNFPGHLPNGQIVPALFEGNTVVFKPSERTPNTAYWIARCIDEAGFPAGVFNMVQGDGRSAAKLSDHEGIDGILFTGSVDVGKKIVAANIDRPGRLVALELGGKNATIVLDDADIERTVRQLAFAAYATSGQRCTATSRVYVERGVADKLVERFAAAARAAKVGYVLDDDVFLGPVIDARSRDALHQAQARAIEAGFEAVVPGGRIEVAGRDGFYCQPSVHLAPRADIRVDGYTHDELFGPDVAIYPVDSLDEAIGLANGTRYGLATAVFTGAREQFDYAADRLRTGVLHWNRSSAGASGRLPFGGVNESGNHRPAGILVNALCVYPQAVLFSPPADAPMPTWPGFKL